MYLKSIEIHGFKSFANKIVFQFHNGITAIVGPNGSGKSNVGDAVRWVLGEQSARQLRGASMQDVIFSGTEARKPLGYASVSITLDNADHKLSVAYDEVTVTRRVYRSGESEYLLNGTQVRLRDVQELFYDTGIGKEGYSIIGQGQIEKILSGKPEERRELFDEAAGIVKFKRRKVTTQKKLEDERQNLVRINDILSELTRQIGPMERQAETAKVYLGKRETLKSYEVQLFLSEIVRLKQELEQTERSYDTSSEQLARTKEAYEQAKMKYGQLEQELEHLEHSLQEKKDASADAQLEQQRLSGQMELMGEQINTARANEEHFQTRLEVVGREMQERAQQQKQAADELTKVCSSLETAMYRETQASEALEAVRSEMADLADDIESGKNELIELLNGRAVLKANSQRYATMMEQVSIRQAQLSQQVLQRKSEEAVWQEQIDQAKHEEDKVADVIAELHRRSDEAGEQLAAIQQKLSDCNQRMEQEQVEYHREASRLESLKNIAERYDGYGSSIRRVMEQKERYPGIHGVVADLIKTEKEYETAVETALGGSIQNIVTDSEETARDMIAFLKRNKYGRATFLPLTGISSRGSFQNGTALREPGVIGLASTLVHFDPQYRDLIEYLLGKTLVVDTIDHAIALARKYRHTLRIVTLEGELLSPGGSMTGGAFRNTSNLLGRRREIEDLKHQVKSREKALEVLQKENISLRNERNRLRDALVQLKDEMQKNYLVQNTVQMQLRELREKKEQASTGYEKLHAEAREIEQQIREIKMGQQDGQQELLRSEDEEIRLGEQSRDSQERLDRKREEEKTASDQAEQARMDVAQLQQQESFIRQNLERLSAEVRHLDEERQQMEQDIAASTGQIERKQQEIEAARQAIRTSEARREALLKEIEQLSDTREDKNRTYKKFFEHRESLSEQMNLLDRECFRLNAQKEKLTEQKDGQINYMWDEYGLTYTAALAQKSGENQPPHVLKRLIQDLKAEIKGLGNVNVNAIEEFRELSERHTFLSTQHDDIVRAEESLQKIILELDEGMRAQFTQEFGRIQKEFDKAFKELFGGGKGTLELVEDEDILEAGIRIIAQPPGKKLQNMMQMSGGEKALTAIALLFAIQNLKPSPFCLLDEIEAALDESNVDRYARYLHKLTKHTQFIIITHRRGTMTAADRLYGITMQEKGVSALVSVNLIEQELDE